MTAPSVSIDVTLFSLYRKDDGGSTTSFLPLVGTVRSNGDSL